MIKQYGEKNMEMKKSKTYEVLDLINWKESGDLNISPKYQRNPVWDNVAKSFLIDTIMRDYPMPPLFLRQIFNLAERRTMREVIDGQQRSRAIIGYYNNEFPILKKHNNMYGGKYFKDLEPEDQEHFLKYNIFIDTISEKDDSIIYDIFARMNSNAANVNKQEIRNAKFWGDFKTSVYSVASNIREFFIDYNIFTNKNLARMKDMEFVSVLFILAMDGCTSQSDSQIDKYYRDYDKDFTDALQIEERILSAIDVVKSIFEYVSEPSFIFRNTNYLYDLIGTIFVVNGVISVPNCNINGEMLSPSRTAEILLNMHYGLAEIKNTKNMSTEIDISLVDYEKMHRIHSTDKGNREKRIKFLLDSGIIKNYE